MKKQNFNNDTLNRFSEITITTDKITITIPIKELLISQENRSDIPLRITDTAKMIRWINEHIFIFLDDPKSDYTEWNNFWDSLFDEAYSTAESWLEGIIK